PPSGEDTNLHVKVKQQGAVGNLGGVPLQSQCPARRIAMSEVHEIADGIYRISHFDANHAPVEFSQFLIKDERPLLFHTGAKALFPDTLEAVKKVLDPASLSYISWSHLESDECGALNDFLSV